MQLAIAICAYYYDEDFLIVKIQSIDVNHTTVTIQGEETDLEEVFNIVKYEGNSSIAEAKIDNSNLEEGVKFNGLIKDDDAQPRYGIQPLSVEIGGHLNKTSASYSLGDVKIGTDDIYRRVSGSITFTIDPTAKIYLSWETQYVEVKLNYSAIIKVSASGKVRGSIPFGGFSFELGEGVKLNLTPSFVVDVSGEFEVEGSLTGEYGFRISSDDGIKGLSIIPKLEAKVKAEITVFLGLSFEPEFKTVGDVIKIDLKAEGGGEIRAKLKRSTEVSEDEKHHCMNCVKGGIYGKFEFSIEFDWFGQKFTNDKNKKQNESNKQKQDKDKEQDKGKSKWTVKDLFSAGIDAEIKLLDFYYSLDYDEFAFTVCPHIEYKTTIQVTDKKNNVLGGVTIRLYSNTSTADGGNTPKLLDTYTTDEKGCVETWLYGGEYAVIAVKDNTSVSKSVTVKEASTITVVLNPQYKTTIQVTDSNNKALGGVTIKLYQNTASVGGRSASDLLGSYTTDGNGCVEVLLYGGEYTVVATNNSASVTKSFTVKNDSTVTVVLNASQYKTTIRVTDDNKKALGGVTVKLYKMVSSDGGSTSELLGSYTTDNDGCVEVLLYGGEYTIVAANASASVTKSFTVKNDSTVTVVLSTVSEPGQSVSLGGTHSAAITEDRRLYLWGWNEDGQLGNGTTQNSSTPIKIMDNVKSVSLGYNHSAAITEDGSLYLWGYNYYGQLGNGTAQNSSTPIKIMDNVKSVSLGDLWHSAAITEDGSLYLWGYNVMGQLGNGTPNGSNWPIKIMDNVKSVSLGREHSAAITEDGSLYLWGYNYYGQLGNGDKNLFKNGSSTPIKIMDNVKSVSLGYNHSAAITEDGSLYLWGWNEYGQLGNGSHTSRSTPIKIMDNVKSVSLGGCHSAAITEDGSLYLWGDNYYGQLGDGTRAEISRPIKIMENVKSVSLGREHSAAITEDGSLYLWGNNAVGQLGDGTGNSSNVPIKIEIPIATSSPNSYTSMASAMSRSVQQTQTAEFSDLTPNRVYNFYVMKSRTAEQPFSSENLLYVDQGIADQDGKLAFDYISTAIYEDAEIFVVEIPYDILPGADLPASSGNVSGENDSPETPESATVLYIVGSIIVLAAVVGIGMVIRKKKSAKRR